MRTLRLTSLGIAIVGAALSVAAQTPRFEAVRVDSSGYPEIRAELDLRTASGELAGDLTSADISIQENGSVVTGAYDFGPDPDGTALVVALDVSKSMRSEFDKIREFLVTMFAGLGEKDRGAIVVFSDAPNVVSPWPMNDVRSMQADGPFTNEKSLLVNVINNLRVTGDTTELFFAAYQSLQLLQAPELPSRKVLLIISDGKNEGVNYTSEDCVDLARSEGIRILTLGVPSSSPSALLNMRRLAERSGGFYWPVDTTYAGFWMAQVDNVIRHIRNRQLLSWTTTLPRDGDTHRVEIQARVQGSLVTSAASVKVPAAPPAPPERPIWKDPVVVTGSIGGAVLIIGAIAFLFVVMHKKSQTRQLEASDEVKKRVDQVDENLKAILNDFASVRSQLPAAETGARHEPPPAGPRAEARRGTVFMPEGQSGSRAYSSAWLEVADGPQQGQRFQLDRDASTIGRDPGSDITLDEHRVSSRHAMISKQENGFVIEDLGSTNGTYLESGERLTRGVQSHPLANGELIRIGGVIVLFRGQP